MFVVVCLLSLPGDGSPGEEEEDQEEDHQDRDGGPGSGGRGGHRQDADRGGGDQSGHAEQTEGTQRVSFSFISSHEIFLNPQLFSNIKDFSNSQVVLMIQYSYLRIWEII